MADIINLDDYRRPIFDIAADLGIHYEYQTLDIGTKTDDGYTISRAQLYAAIDDALGIPEEHRLPHEWYARMTGID